MKPISKAYVDALEFIDAVRKHPQFQNLRRTVGRRKARKFELEDEFFAEVIDRMEQETEHYIDWDDISEFFTRRGRPRTTIQQLQQSEKAMIDVALSSDPEDKAAQTTGKTINYNYQRDGYDSDPEFHTYSKEVEYEFKLPRGQVDLSPGKTRWKYDIDEEQLKHRTYTAESSAEPTRHDRSYQIERPETVSHKLSRGRSVPHYLDKRFGAIYKDKNTLHYTLPEPFEFDSRDRSKKKSIRERRIEEDIRAIREEEEKMLKHTFRAKSVPASTTGRL